MKLIKFKKLNIVSFFIFKGNKKATKKVAFCNVLFAFSGDLSVDFRHNLICFNFKM